MDFERDYESMMMNVRSNSGAITQTIIAAKMTELKLIQFLARMAYKGYLTISSRDNLQSFAKLSEGRYTIYNIPVTTDFSNDIKQLEQLKLNLQNSNDRQKSKALKNDIKELENRINAGSPLEELKQKGIKNMCVLPKIDGESGTIQVAIMNSDEQIFKNWFGSHITRNMSGGQQDIKELKNFTEGNYSIFNLPFEGKELEDACRDFDMLKINYSVLPDLKIGNDNSQVAVANADRNKLQMWIKMYREEMIKNDREPGSIYEMNEDSYMDTAIVDENEYIDNASMEYKQANESFEENQANVQTAPAIIRKDDCDEYVRLKKDDNFEMVTINKESLVDNMTNTAASKQMSEGGYFVSRIPGTYGENEKYLILPRNNVFIADGGKTYVGFIPKDNTTMVMEPGGKIKDTSFEKVYKPYEAVSRNMAYVKSLQNTAPKLNKQIAKAK